MDSDKFRELSKAFAMRSSGCRVFITFDGNVILARYLQSMARVSQVKLDEYVSKVLASVSATGYCPEDDKDIF